MLSNGQRIAGYDAAAPRNLLLRTQNELVTGVLAELAQMRYAEVSKVRKVLTLRH